MAFDMDVGLSIGMNMGLDLNIGLGMAFVVVSVTSGRTMAIPVTMLTFSMRDALKATLSASGGS